MNTPQMSRWNDRFGRDYTDRNSLTLSELDVLYHRNYGVTRRELNERFLPESRGAREFSKSVRKTRTVPAE